MTDNTKIHEALQLLDAKDNSHWTNDGLPRVDIVAKLIDAPSLSRADITAAAPTFTRENLTFEPTPPEQDNPAAPAQEEGVKTEENPAQDPAPSEEQEKAKEDQPEPSPLPPATEIDELDEAAMELLAANDELTSYEAEMSALAAKKAAAQAKVDALIEARALQDSPHQNQKDIMAYLEGQAKLREQKAAALGVPARSRLDQALGFKRGYGANRPSFGN
jgi:hypothetical protein